MAKNKVIEGKLEYDRDDYGDDYSAYTRCDLYIGENNIESLLANYCGKTIRITIEEIEPKESE